jgi:cell division protein FtsB
MARARDGQDDQFAATVGQLEGLWWAMRAHAAEQAEAFRRESSTLRGSIATLGEENKAHHALVATLRESIAALGEENKTLREENKTLREENKTLADDNKALRENHRALREENRALADDNKALHREIAAEAADSEALGADNEALRAELMELDAENLRLHAELVKFDEELSYARTALVRCQDEYGLAKRRYEAIDAEAIAERAERKFDNDRAAAKIAALREQLMANGQAPVEECEKDTAADFYRGRLELLRQEMDQIATVIKWHMAPCDKRPKKKPRSRQGGSSDAVKTIWAAVGALAERIPDAPPPNAAAPPPPSAAAPPPSAAAPPPPSAAAPPSMKMLYMLAQTLERFNWMSELTGAATAVKCPFSSAAERNAVRAATALLRDTEILAEDPANCVLALLLATCPFTAVRVWSSKSDDRSVDAIRLLGSGNPTAPGRYLDALREHAVVIGGTVALHSVCIANCAPCDPIKRASAFVIKRAKESLLAARASGGKPADAQLRCADEQLRCADEQLRCADEQLRCADEQLRCADEQLRCADEQLLSEYVLARVAAMGVLCSEPAAVKQQ